MIHFKLNYHYFSAYAKIEERIFVKVYKQGRGLIPTHVISANLV